MVVTVGGVVASMILIHFYGGEGWGYIIDHMYGIILLLIFFGIVWTLIINDMDKLCTDCCSCFLSAPGQLSVFDPDHPEKKR